MVGLKSFIFLFSFFRTEAEYAFKRNVPAVPLKVEEGYEPDGWLGRSSFCLLYCTVINIFAM